MRSTWIGPSWWARLHKPVPSNRLVSPPSDRLARRYWLYWEEKFFWAEASADVRN